MQERWVQHFWQKRRVDKEDGEDMPCEAYPLC